MEGETKIQSPEVKAEQLTDRLRATYHEALAAVADWSHAQDEAGRLLESCGFIPKPEEGLDEPYHTLYETWTAQPTAETIQDSLES